MLFISAALTVSAVIGLGISAVCWKLAHQVEPIPEEKIESWGEYWPLVTSFYQMLPSKPSGTGWAGAHCAAVGSITVRPGDPVPVRQIICDDDNDLTTVFTEYANPADLKTYVDAHTVRVRERESPGGSMALLRPTDPSATFVMASHPSAEPNGQTMLVEASSPGKTFDDLYLSWWLWAQIK
ncbi:hypothetical protein ACQP06_04410 [Nocardia sp. CA-136227]|uniref:hypothetical protein n=1 Tax=Nocardia sp. CA-136227 TaxID=3239979 RepID=UPI003D96E3EB